MCEDKEEARSEAEASGPSPRRLCWPRRPPAPLSDTRGLCCAKLLRKNGKAKKLAVVVRSLTLIGCLGEDECGRERRISRIFI
ncbi:hypothetical protein RR48_10693 [Papilio machaon]|uniref:Uncharacterized protein n=1 Tax=Papilio machaon TaxID=76193 RepID=A0A194RMV4_PAPMA|nr:hypothetical protein RR48_10693 [Papilio machaon]